MSPDVAPVRRFFLSSAIFLPYRTDPMRRQLRWKAFIEEQRSFSQFCDGIRLKFGVRQPGDSHSDREKPLVLAYGRVGTLDGGPCQGDATVHRQWAAEEALSRLPGSHRP
eukprot:4216721-Prymnesium_polylepis.1